MGVDAERKEDRNMTLRLIPILLSIPGTRFECGVLLRHQDLLTILGNARNEGACVWV